MKLIPRLLALLLALTLVCATVGASAATYYAKQVYNCNEYVTLRAKPSGKANAVCRVSVGEVVMASNYNNEFSYCCYNGKYGYIKNQYLTTSLHPYGEGTFHVVNCNSYITLRAMPMTSAEALARVPLGAEFDAIYYNAYDSYDPDAFAFVRYNGQYGWVLWRYIESIYQYGWQ